MSQKLIRSKSHPRVGLGINPRSCPEWGQNDELLQVSVAVGDGYLGEVGCLAEDGESSIQEPECFDFVEEVLDALILLTKL